MRRRPPSLLAAAALVLVLAALVAVASGGTPAWALLRPATANRSAILAGVAVLCVIGGLAAAAVTFMVHRAVIARRPDAPPLRITLLRALPATVVALAALNLFVIARIGAEPGAWSDDEGRGAFERSGRRAGLWGFIDPRDPGVRAGDGLADEEGGLGAGAATDNRLRYVLVLIGIALVALAAGAALRRRAAGPASPDAARHDDYAPEPDRESVHGAVVDTIDAMLADPDPGTAIIGAYARLLEGLAAHGAGRLEHEAPNEHVRRVLTMLDVRPEPVRRLIGLFELARFSTHPLTPAHREQALDALRDVATDLAGVPALAAAGTGVQRSGAGP